MQHSMQSSMYQCMLHRMTGMCCVQRKGTYVHAKDTALFVVLLAEVVEIDIKVVVPVHIDDAGSIGAVVQLFRAQRRQYKSTHASTQSKDTWVTPPPERKLVGRAARTSERDCAYTGSGPPRATRTGSRRSHPNRLPSPALTCRELCNNRPRGDVEVWRCRSRLEVFPAGT